SEVLEGKVSIKAQISELENKIAAVCIGCPHVKWYTGFFKCRVDRCQCHSRRVRQWQAEIEKLEEVTDV
ncbi:unnamed protein product, partial [marine sediment metagenome]